jgi:hypothetical protein
MTAGPTVIRASSAPTVLDCTRRWAGQALEEEIFQALGTRPRYLPMAIGAPIGTGVHALGAHLLTRKMDGFDPLFKPAREAGMAALDVALYDGEILWDGTAANRNDAQEQVSRMGLAYSEQIVPFVDPKLVEEEMRATFAPGFTVVGHLDDLVLVGGEHRIRDTKTGGTPGGMLSQQGLYSLLAQTHGWQVDGLDVDYIKRVPLVKTQPPVRTLALDKDAAEQSAHLALTIAIASTEAFRRTRSMDAFRPNPSSKFCSAKFCSLHSTPLCRAHFPTDEDDQP